MNVLDIDVYFTGTRWVSFWGFSAKEEPQNKVSFNSSAITTKIFISIFTYQTWRSEFEHLSCVYLEGTQRLQLISQEFVISVRLFSVSKQRLDFYLVPGSFRPCQKKNNDKLCKQRGSSVGIQAWLSPLFVACLAVLKQMEYLVCCLWGFFFFLRNRKQFCGAVCDIRQANPWSRSVNHSFNWSIPWKPHVNN